MNGVDLGEVQFTSRTAQIHNAATLLVSRQLDADASWIASAERRQEIVDAAVDTATKLYDTAIVLDKTNQEKQNEMLQALLNRLAAFATKERPGAVEVLDWLISEMKRQQAMLTAPVDVVSPLP